MKPNPPGSEGMVCVDKRRPSRVGGRETCPHTNPLAFVVIACSPANLKEKIAMPNEKFDYAAMLSDLRAKKAVLEASIATLESAMALGVLGQLPEGVELSAAASSSGTVESAVPIELPHHAFLGVSMPQAIKTYLEVVKKKQTVREISAALKEHGMESTSDSFEGIVTSALNRLKGNGEVLRFKDGWGLTAWYPASLRNQINTAAKPRKNGKKRNKKKKNEPEAKAEATPTIPKRIAELLNKKNGTPLAANQIAEELGISTKGLALILGGMVARKTIIKTENGLYSASLSNVREMAAVI